MIFNKCRSEAVPLALPRTPRPHRPMTCNLPAGVRAPEESSPTPTTFSTYTHDTQKGALEVSDAASLLALDLMRELNAVTQVQTF